jgi:hypothetical protein
MQVLPLLVQYCFGNCPNKEKKEPHENRQSSSNHFEGNEGVAQCMPKPQQQQN